MQEIKLALTPYEELGEFEAKVCTHVPFIPSFRLYISMMDGY